MSSNGVQEVVAYRGALARYKKIASRGPNSKLHQKNSWGVQSVAEYRGNAVGNKRRDGCADET